MTMHDLQQQLAAMQAAVYEQCAGHLDSCPCDYCQLESNLGHGEWLAGNIVRGEARWGKAWVGAHDLLKEVNANELHVLPRNGVAIASPPRYQPVPAMPAERQPAAGGA